MLSYTIGILNSVLMIEFSNKELANNLINFEHVFSPASIVGVAEHIVVGGSIWYTWLSHCIPFHMICTVVECLCDQLDCAQSARFQLRYDQFEKIESSISPFFSREMLLCRNTLYTVDSATFLQTGQDL